MKFIKAEDKPFFNDTEFVDLIQSLVTQPLDIMQLKPLNYDRATLFNNL